MKNHAIYWQYLIEHASKKQFLYIGETLQFGVEKLETGTKVKAKDIKHIKDVGTNIYTLEKALLCFNINHAPPLLPRHAKEWLSIKIIEYCKQNHSRINLYQSNIHDKMIQQGASHVFQYHAIILRLNILESVIPEAFEKTLFGLMLITFESALSHADSASFNELFLCCAAHDLGLIELDPLLLSPEYSNTFPETPDEKYFHHVQLGANILIRSQCSKNAILKGVLQHHERMDGTGKPAGLVGKQLCEYGQHLHLYDRIFHLFKNNCIDEKKLADLIPIIEMNAITHFGNIASRFIQLLKTSPTLTPENTNNHSLGEIQDQCQKISQSIERAIAVIQAFTQKVGFRHENKQLMALQNSFFHIALADFRNRNSDKKSSITYQSLPTPNGIQPSNRSSLYQSEETLAITENDLIQLRELMFHIREFQKKLFLFTQQCENPEVLTAALQTGKRISEIRGFEMDSHLNLSKNDVNPNI